MAEKREGVTAKKSTKKAAAKPAAEETTDTQKLGFRLTADGETKQYAKFSPPADSGCVGTLYVPKGTQTVKVLLEGPAS